MDKKEIRTKFLLQRLSKVYQGSCSSHVKDLSNLSAKKVLFISPHADDEVIGCGAAINHFVNQQHAEVTVLVVTKEVQRSIAKSYDYTAEQRIDESHEAKEVLGYQNLIYFDFPELELNRNEALRKEFYEQLSSFLQNLKPECVFIPNAQEMHPDHRSIGQLSWDVIVEGKRNNIFESIKNTLIYEVWGPVNMNAYLEISEESRLKKEKSISCYKSQMASVDYKAVINFIGTFRGAILRESKIVIDEVKTKMYEGYRIFEDNELKSFAQSEKEENKWIWT